MRALLVTLVLSTGLWATSAGAQAPDRPAFRALYEELVEIDSSEATGSCTRATEAMAARLTAAGYPRGDVHLIVPPGKPDDGNLVAHLRGTGRGAILLLAHIDVVNANRAAQWNVRLPDGREQGSVMERDS